MQSDTQKRLLIFGLIALVLMAACAVLYGRTGQGAWLVVCMFTPALSVVITRLCTHEGARDLYLWPRLRGHLRWYAFAWFGTPLLVFAGAALYFCLFPGQFDPLGSGYARQLGVTVGADYAANLAVMLPLAILVNPWMGLLSCLGEEFAWRAYLFPKLCEALAPAPAALVTGAVWGLWHAPFIAMGYNYGPEHPWLGVLAMILFCMVLGCIQAYLFLHVGSVWPAVLFHASLNALDLAAPSELLMSGPSNAFVGPDPIGCIGGAGLIVAAAFCLYGLTRRKPAASGPKT